MLLIHVLGKQFNISSSWDTVRLNQSVKAIENYQTANYNYMSKRYNNTCLDVFDCT